MYVYKISSVNQITFSHLLIFSTDQRQKQIGNAQSTKNRGSTPEHNEGYFHCSYLTNYFCMLCIIGDLYSFSYSSYVILYFVSK